MFDNDFYELKKALESVTLEVTHLKNELHKKDLEIEKLKESDENKLRTRVGEQDKIIEELRENLKKAQVGLSGARADNQALQDRIAGLIRGTSDLETQVKSLRDANVEQDLKNRELQLELKQSLLKTSRSNADFQDLHDRIAGLVKENTNLKREAIAKQMVSKTFNGVKGLVDQLKPKVED